MAHQRIMLLMFEIGRRGALEQPAQSPDLTFLLTIFCRVVSKILFTKNKPRNLSSLKQSIVSAFSTIDFDLCNKVCESVPERLSQFVLTINDIINFLLIFSCYYMEREFQKCVQIILQHFVEPVTNEKSLLMLILIHRNSY